VSGWNVADVWDEIARLRPERQAVVRGDDVRSWARFEQGAALVAAGLREAGLRRQAKVAIYLHNSIEYLEVLYGAFKGSLVPVNTNYRYVDRELVALWQAADVEAVVFHGAFSTTVDALRSEVPGVRLWWWVDDGSGPCPAWARPFDTRPGEVGPAAPDTDDVRSGDDLLLLYTGGTTGLPRGVMWRQDDMFVVINRIASLRYPEEPDLAAVEAVVGAVERSRTRVLPAAPLMHGTAMFTALGALDAGGTVVLSSGVRFDPVELLDIVERERVSLVSLVGDAFARPVVDQLEAHPGRWDLTSLQVIVSSGVMWSQPVRDALLAHIPGLACVDTFGASEAIGVARSISSLGRSAPTGGFELGPGAQVLGDDGEPVVPGSGEVGLVASSGRGPIGYYRDPEATARAFRVMDGVRWITPGDRAVVEADGTVRLLGRGSGCINTGGEKVFPEEVEEALKLEPAVRDAVVVGVPDERLGEIVVGIVEPMAGGHLSAAELRQIRVGLERRLAGYKVPRRWLVVDTIGRTPNGKVDQRRLRGEARRAAGGD
jgi:acyl-CoA synthetase (AMP-forming)/AMP-acid ligase II